jgi:four helix bundle protein
MIKLIDLEVYKIAIEIGDKVWDIVDKWDSFNKNTLGYQFVRAADSIALNIAEGYGRFFYKENKNFNYYSRGSAFETTACLKKAIKRKLITDEQNLDLRKLLGKYLLLQNSYIKSIGTAKTENEVQEDFVPYQVKINDLEDLMTNDSMTNDPMTQ